MAKSNKRPAKGGKGQLLQVRLDDDEKAAFEAVAALYGWKVSVWVRDRLRTAAYHELVRADKPPPPFVPSANEKPD